MARCFRSRTTSFARRAGGALALAAGVSACDVPNFEGPQIQDPPQGFLLAPDSYQQRRLFPDRELIFHAAWVESIDDFSTIYIDGHRGVLGLEDAVAARDSARRYATDPDVRFGEVEPLEVDGRSAWGWFERVETPTRGLVWVAYRAIIPYDTVSYAVEFYSGEPAIKREAPDTLKAIIATFGIGETTYNIPLIAVMIGLALFAASVVQSKRRAQAARMKTINLVKVEKKKAPETPETASASDVAAPTGPAAPAPAPPGPPRGAAASAPQPPPGQGRPPGYKKA
ncbi:MAG: hypothetical protein FJ207_08895 [Gemmatimonadetes bacterium]|nr:hypothetical protein [Gemmatimonadota bacterium]